MKVTIVLLSLFTALFATQDALLTISRSNSCLRDLVSSFVRAEDCTSLTDSQKAKLAMKMAECLLQEMGKQFPKGCSEQPSSCQLQGDAWNTFSTFFAHIDNLCHFYWQTLQHQRAEKLIGELSQSSSKAEAALKQNAQQTNKILSMQHQMHSSLEQSLKSQQAMAQLINSSALRISNLTQQVQTFVQKIHEDIDANYASIRTLLVVISQGIAGIVEVQNYIRAQLSSVGGIVFFLSQFLVVLFVTSFKKYQTLRNKLVTLLGVEVVLQFILSDSLSVFFDLKLLRYGFIVFMGVTLLSETRENQLQVTIINSLSSTRLQNLFRKVSQQQNRELINNICLSSMTLRGTQANWYNKPKVLRQIGVDEQDEKLYA